MSIVGLSSQNPRFSPQDVPGLGIWLDGADTTSVVLSGANVTQWTDKSGNGRHATAQVAATYQSNALNFTGSNYYSMTDLSFAVGSYFTFFLTEKLQSSNNYPHLLASDTGGVANGSPHIRYNGTSFGTTNASAFRFAFWNNDLDVAVTGFTTAGAQPIRIWSLVLAPSFRGIYLNGSLLGSNTNGTQLVQWATPVLGRAFADPVSYYNGFMYEVLGYGGVLATSQRQAIEGYLARKWSLTSALPSSHPYKSVSSVPTRPFTPLDIDGCTLWLDAADSSTLTLSGSNVTSWTDKSGTSTVTQSTTSVQPTYQATAFGGLPTVRFSTASGTQELVATTSAYSGITSLFIFLVYRIITPLTATYPSPISLVNKVSVYLRGGIGGGSSTDVWTYNGSGFASTSNSTLTTDANGLLCLALDSNQTLFNNGSQCPSVSFSFGGATSVDLHIGYSGYNGNDAFNGYLSEVLLYTSPLSSSQRQQVETYLATKWGLRGNLPSGSWGRLYKTLSPVFAPNQLSGLSLWLDAADRSTLTLSGSNVTQWTDKSISNVAGTVFAGSSAIQPTWSSNTIFLNNNGSSYNSSTYVCFSMAANPLSATTETTFFAVFRLTSGANLDAIIQITNGSDDQYRIIGQQQTIETMGGTMRTVNAPAFDTTTTLMTWNSLNSGSYVYKNGVLHASNTTAVTLGNPSGPLYIGGGKSDARWFSGYLSEILWYSSPLSFTQRQRVEGYLANKWGLTSSLPSSHPYKTFKP